MTLSNVQFVQKSLMFKTEKYKEYIRELGIKEQLRYFLLVHAPFVFDIYKKSRKWVNINVFIK